MYNFLLNMWIMRKIEEDYLQGQVARGRITSNEMMMITITPQR